MATIQDLEAKYIINTYNRQPGITPYLVRGEGSYLWDEKGNKYLDFLGGLAVNVVGHCNPRVVKAICSQSAQLNHVSNLYYSGPQSELARQLIENSMPGGKLFYANSGAEANEAAIKMARKNKQGCYKIVTAQGSFHGRTLAALTATGQPKYQKGFEPLVDGFSYATFNDLDSFTALVDEETAAIMIEPVQGEGGVHVAGEAFIKGLRELCDKRGILLIFDEVQCGMGRTGKLWAFQNWGVMPDLLTTAKGLGGGLPIGALLVREPFTALFQPGDHASTFGGNPVVCSAALAVLSILHQEGFFQEVVDKGTLIRNEFEKLILSNPGAVKEFRGIGLICAIELKQPVAREIYAKCLSEGLLINAIGDTTLRLLPPLNLSGEELNEGLKILKSLISDI